MKPDNRAYRIAIVGGGPRGLAACEALADAAQHCGPIEVSVLEPHPTPGAGPHHDPDQTALNRLNIPRFAIEIPECARSDAEGFDQWARRIHPELGEDDYPPRAVLGQFLDDRWRRLMPGLVPSLSIRSIGQTVLSAHRDGPEWRLVADEQTHGPFDEILLSPGHQPTEPDAQLTRWRGHAATSGATLMAAYPSRAILERVPRWVGRTVAVRGLGLSMIDVMRILTLGTGGAFEGDFETGLRYRASGREPARILPFSLDGIPPVPKPAYKSLDRQFSIPAEAGDRFTAALSAALQTDPTTALDGVCGRLVGLVFDVMGRLGIDVVHGEIEDWLAIERDPDRDHGEECVPVESLKDTFAMAIGRRAPSIGYTMGQVWRKLQTPLRKAFNPIPVPPDAAAELVKFDEGLKRYSYGPPAIAAAEMLALIDAGLLDLRAVDDPDVVLVADGWRLSADEGEAGATVMIDGVLDAPDLSLCAAPLIAGLRERGLLVPVGEKLGARTRADGQAIGADGMPVPGLSLVGRLALGSVIATDSVHDCFGEAIGRWARAAIVRAKGQ